MVEILAEKYILLDLLLFKLVTIPEKETALLAITEYHSSHFAGHQGVINTYLTIGDKFFIPGLIHYLQSYIKGCHTCQLTRKDKSPTRQLQAGMNLNYRPLSRLNMDLKVIPKSYKGHKFILCIIDEVTNYLVTTPIYQSRSEEIGKAQCDLKILCAKLHYNGPGQCIHVITHELSVQETQHEDKNSSILQASVITGRTLYKVTISHLDITLD